MSRFGFDPNQIMSLIKQILEMPGINLRGIYSHLAQAANPDQTFNNEQESTFINVIKELESLGIFIPYKDLRIVLAQLRWPMIVPI